MNDKNSTHVESNTNGKVVNEIQHESGPNERELGVRRKVRKAKFGQPVRLRTPITTKLEAHGNSKFVNNGRKVKIQLSTLNTFSANIFYKTVRYLIDTGASIHLIDYEWLISNFHNDAYRLEKPRFNSARVVSGADMPIEGFVVLSLSINSHTLI